jgi:low temperature requirement protein LtrA
MSRQRRRRLLATDEGHRVTPFEVFFDLVFVFAFTRITSFMSADLTPLALVRGLILLVLMWWAWSAYTWLGNQVRADVGPALVAGVGAMAAIFIVALVVPDAWRNAPGGVHEPRCGCCMCRPVWPPPPVTRRCAVNC